MTNVLLVEDDEAMRNLYRNAFMLSGYQVVTAENGEEVFTALKNAKHPPDIILLDFMMPKMNGLDVLRKMSSDPEFITIKKNVPIVILTNLESIRGSEDLEMALELGATEYFIKSQHDPKDIVQKVAAILEKRTTNHH